MHMIEISKIYLYQIKRNNYNSLIPFTNSKSPNNIIIQKKRLNRKPLGNQIF